MPLHSFGNWIAATCEVAGAYEVLRAYDTPMYHRSHLDQQVEV
jgi:hypothetical protein